MSSVVVAAAAAAAAAGSDEVAVEADGVSDAESGFGAEDAGADGADGTMEKAFGCERSSRLVREPRTKRGGVGCCCEGDGRQRHQSTAGRGTTLHSSAYCCLSEKAPVKRMMRPPRR